MWPSTATALAFTKDGRSIIAGYQDGSVVWWSLDARMHPVSTTLTIGRKDAESFRFTRDGATLLRLDENGRVMERVNVPGRPPGPAEPLAIATSSGVRDATSGRVLLIPEPHVTAVAVSGDSRVAATLTTTPKSEAGETLHIGIWDVERKCRTKTFDAGVRWASHLTLDETGSARDQGSRTYCYWDVARADVQEFAVGIPSPVAISPAWWPYKTPPTPLYDLAQDAAATLPSLEARSRSHRRHDAIDQPATPSSLRWSPPSARL